MPLSPKNLLKLKDEFVLTSATGLALLVQFIFQAVIVRMVSPEVFGHISSLLAIQGILNIPIAVWQLAQARSLSSYSGSSKQFGAFAVQQLFQIRHAVLVGLILYLLWGPLVAVYIKGTSWSIWLLVVLGCLFSVIESWGLACFQSRHAFIWLGLVSIGAALARLASIMILLPQLDSVIAVLTAVLAGFSIPIIGIFLFLRHTNKPAQEEKVDYLELSLAPASLSTVFTILWLNIDFIIARNRFDPVMAGQYATVAVLCKAVFWFANPIATVYLPRFVKAQFLGAAVALQMLRRAFFLCLSVCVPALLVGWLLSGWLLALFAGKVDVAQMSEWLKYAIIAKLPIVCVTPFLAYFVAKDSKRVLVILLSILCLMFLYAQAFADHVNSLLLITFAGGLVLILTCSLAAKFVGDKKDIQFSWEGL